jgi:orotidine-5'-phosphate decarboxylase
MKFRELLETAWRRHDSLVCVGLDPEPKKFPAQFRGSAQAIFEFNKAIVDATRDLVCAYKPQFAHYAAHRAEEQLERTIAYIKDTCPDALVILDSKRGDIGSTAEQYAAEAFERYRADAVTVNPYLGFDSLEPFLKHESKGVVILCRTSNPGARDLQDLDVGGRKLYQFVAERVARQWNTRGNCMLVVGATYPDELADIRARTGDMPFLVPGVGAQGGDVALAVNKGKTSAGQGLVISSSRAILYASAGEDFAAAARAAAAQLRTAINQQR